MSATATPPAVAAGQAHLVEAVAAPAFAAKLAAAGVVPSDAAEGDRLRLLGDRIDHAVGRYLDKVAAVRTATQTAGMKAALDTAFGLTGDRRPAPPPDVTPYLAAAGVKEAAAALVAARTAPPAADPAAA